MKRYMMSDIHGFLEAFEAALKKTDLSGKNQLILLGDYIDYGPDGRAVLEKVRALQEKYGSEKVIALMGNHEKALLDWLEEYAESTGISAVWSDIAAGNGWHRMQMETMKRCTAF